MKTYRLFVTGYEPPAHMELAIRRRLITESDGLVMSRGEPIPVGAVLDTEFGVLEVVGIEHHGKVVLCEPAKH